MPEGTPAGRPRWGARSGRSALVRSAGRVSGLVPRARGASALSRGRLLRAVRAGGRAESLGRVVGT